VTTLRSWLGHGWRLAFVIWTIVIVIAMVPSWPAATAPQPPCAYAGNPNPNPALPICPMDGANYAGLAVLLLFALWVIGLLVLLTAFVVSRRRS
jgi:hypothetical protein